MIRNITFLLSLVLAAHKCPVNRKDGGYPAAHPTSATGPENGGNIYFKDGGKEASISERTWDEAYQLAQSAVSSLSLQDKITLASGIYCHSISQQE